MFRPDPVPYFFIEIQIDLQKPNVDPDPKACCHVAVPVVNDSDGGHAGQHEAEDNHDERVTRNLHSVYIRIRIKTKRNRSVPIVSIQFVGIGNNPLAILINNYRT